MTPEMQKEAIATLAEVWSLSPDIRLGQLLAHVGFLGEAHLGAGWDTSRTMSFWPFSTVTGRN